MNLKLQAIITSPPPLYRRQLHAALGGIQQSGISPSSLEPRLKIVPKGEARPIFSDLYSKTEKHLIEVKGSVSRDAIRMAIGQLCDYRRFVEAGTRLSILLPEVPRPDLQELIHSAGISIIYPSGTAFTTVTKGEYSVR